jgi:hypothetical protein
MSFRCLSVQHLSVVFSESKNTVGLTGIARKTVGGLVERMNQLYEQGADAIRIGDSGRCGKHRHSKQPQFH